MYLEIGGCATHYGNDWTKDKSLNFRLFFFGMTYCMHQKCNTNFVTKKIDDFQLNWKFMVAKGQCNEIDEWQFVCEWNDDWWNHMYMNKLNSWMLAVSIQYLVYLFVVSDRACLFFKKNAYTEKKKYFKFHWYWIMKNYSCSYEYFISLMLSNYAISKM